MAGLELANASEDGARPRHVAQREVEVEGFRVDLARYLGQLEERLDLRGKREMAWAQMVVERLDPEAVAGQQQAPATVPEREGEHAAQVGNACLLFFLVPVDDDLGVAAGEEAMSARRQPCSELGIIVDLAVAHH